MLQDARWMINVSISKLRRHLISISSSTRRTSAVFTFIDDHSVDLAVAISRCRDRLNSKNRCLEDPPSAIQCDEGNMMKLDALDKLDETVLQCFGWTKDKDSRVCRVSAKCERIRQ